MEARLICKSMWMHRELEHLNVRELAALRVLNHNLMEAEQWIFQAASDLAARRCDGATFGHIDAQVICIRRRPRADSKCEGASVVAILQTTWRREGEIDHHASSDDGGQLLMQHGLFHDVRLCRLFLELVEQMSSGKLSDMLAIGSLRIRIGMTHRRELNWADVVLLGGSDRFRPI
jgi:hypothetical protein